MATPDRTRAVLAMLPFLLAAGCGGALPTISESGGCQVRAGAVIPEGGSGLTGYTGIGGAATIVGTCPAEFRVLTRHDGSIVCYGDESWCDAALASQPVEVTPAQLRELLGVEP